MKLTHTLACAALLSTAVLASPSLAQNLSAGSEGTGEASRALPSNDFQFRKAKPTPGLTPEGSSRALELSEEDTIRGFTAIGKSSTGKDVKVEPSEDVKKAVKGQLAPEGDRSIKGDTSEPLLKTEDANRQVFGNDDRVQVKNTKVYPYNVIGYLESKNSKDEYSMCTATLIGPKTLLTAAHCVYDHKEPNGWLDGFTFVPAIAGPEDAPYGAYEYDTAYVNQGYIDNYKGQYDPNIIKSDLAIVTLKDPIGDALGWLGYYAYPDLANFEANIAGYQGDKPQFTMWRTKCDVLAERVEDDVFSYDCDTYQGSSGSAVYAYDSGAKQRVIVGVNVASGPEIMNQAVRLNEANVAWINTLNK